MNRKGLEAICSYSEHDFQPKRSIIERFCQEKSPAVSCNIFSSEVSTMPMSQRVLLAVGILAVDLVLFFVPLTALFLVYILICNPPWFTAFLRGLDRDDHMDRPAGAG
jgi:hypothetical protein